VYFIRGLLQALLLCSLVACGGGGGGGGGNPSGNSISLDRSAIALNISPDAPSNSHDQTVTVTFRGAGVVVGIPPGAPPLPNWLVVSPGTPSANTVQIAIRYVPNGGVGIGRYPYTLRFATGNADGSSVVYRDVPLVVTMLPSITPSAAAVNAVVDGPAITQDIRFTWGDLNWAVRTSAPWITVDRSSGGWAWDNVVRVSMNPAGLAPGEYTGTVYVEEAVGGVAAPMPVRMIVEPRQLIVRQRGVALSQVGSESRLSGSVKIADNGNLGLGWSASSDQPWLTLASTTGTTSAGSNLLAMQADTTGLADGLHYARVTVSPRNEPTLTDSLTVRVGLYVNRGATYLASTTITPRALSGAPNPYFTRNLVTDPIRPYVYQTRGDDRIDVYNTQTGAYVNAITIPGAAVGAAAVSFDGSQLYVTDLAGTGIYPVNLDTWAVGNRLAGMRVPNAVVYTEVSGRRVLLTSELQAVDAQTGQVLADAIDPNGPQDRNVSVAARRDGRAVFFQTSTTNHWLSRYVLMNAGGQFSMLRTHVSLVDGSGRGLAVDADDERLYTLTPGASIGYPLPTEYKDGFIYNTTSFLQVGSLPSCCVSGLAVTARGQLLAGNGLGSGTARLSVFSLDATPIGNFDFTGYSFFNLVVSGDGRRAVLDGGDLRLQELP
jgi:hypothetical protein